MAATAVKRPPKVEVDLMFLLGQASHALETEMTAKLQALGVSPRAHCVLAHARGGELTQSQVAEQCALDKTTMVVTVDELEKAGLAERRPSSTDRRARVITVTDAGRQAVIEGTRIADRVHRDVLGVLPEEQRGVLTDALTLLVNGHLSTPVESGRPVRRARQKRI